MIKRTSIVFLLFIALYVESLELCQQSYGNFTVEPALNLKYACSYADLQTDKLYGRLYLEDLTNVTLETPYTYIWRMQIKGPDSLGLKAKNCSLSTLYDIGILARYQPIDNTTGPLPLNLVISSQYVLTTCNSPYYAFNSSSTYSINLNTSTITFEVSNVPNITAGWTVVFDALKTEPGVIGSVASSAISQFSDSAIDCSSCPSTVPVVPFMTSTTTSSSSEVAAKSKSSNGALIGGIVGGVVGGIVLIAIVVFLIIFFLRRRDTSDNNSYKPSTTQSTSSRTTTTTTSKPNSITTSPVANNTRTPYADMNSMPPKNNPKATPNNIELAVRPPPEPMKKPVQNDDTDDQDDSYLREFKSTVNDVNQALERNSGRQIAPVRPTTTTTAPFTQSGGNMLSTLSSYEIPPSEIKYEEEIGSGAYGVVYRGRWRGALVAVKQLRENIDKELGSFRAEASLMGKLRPHTNVVQMLGVCTKTMPLMIVTEYLPLGSLQSFLTTPRGQSLSVQETLSIIQGIAAGMMHLSSENVVHRDLAARNVLLTSDLVPKISDFGMSRYVMRVDIESTTKTTVGPLKWMAPESILDLVYNEKTDVWSFGIVCWEVLSKSEPYPDLDPVQVASRVSNGKLIPSVSPLWPAVLRDLMTRCWIMNPVNRPTFAEIATILSQ